MARHSFSCIPIFSEYSTYYTTSTRTRTLQQFTSQSYLCARHSSSQYQWQHLKPTGITNHNITILYILQITCHRVSTFFVAKMANSTDPTKTISALVPKKKSLVWDHFTQRVDGSPARGTTSLLSHLRVHHPAQHSSYKR